MGGKRYFCDYCDRTLPYSVEARKKHNYGHQHRAAKQDYYARLKSAKERYEAEVKKTKCKKFYSGQICAFGDSCIFSHLTEAGLEVLRMEAELELKKETVPSQLLREKEPSVDHIESILESKSNPILKQIEETLECYSKPRPSLESYHPLPSSLHHLKMEDILTAQYNTWG